MPQVGVDIDTELVLTGMGIPPYSARGVKQQLLAISASANPRETVNGTLINLSPSQFEKYTTTLTCTDQNSPACDGIFPGHVVTVDCVREFAYLTDSGSPSRPVVEGSSRTVGPWTFYRPRLVMMLKDPIDVTFDEWGAAVAWSMTLSEVAKP